MQIHSGSYFYFDSGRCDRLSFVFLRIYEGSQAHCIFDRDMLNLISCETIVKVNICKGKRDEKNQHCNTNL